MHKSTILIEGQDNNVAHVFETLINNQSVFMQTQEQTYLGGDMYGLGDNPRWLGAELYTEGYRELNNLVLDSFRKEFPNVNAEVKPND